MKYAPQDIGRIVRETRKKLGVTQKDLALTSGTGLRFVIELEKGKPTCEIAEMRVAAEFHEDERSALSLDLQSALRKLPHEQLTCVMLTTYAGYSSQEAGLLLGLTGLPMLGLGALVRRVRAVRVAA